MGNVSVRFDGTKPRSHGPGAEKERDEKEKKAKKEIKLQNNPAVQVQGNNFPIDINRKAQPPHAAARQILNT